MTYAYEPKLESWTLPGVIADICERAGIPFDRFNPGQLDGYVDGFNTTAAISAAAAIEALSGIYLFDAANYGGVLNFVPRGGESVANITLDDLIAGKDDELDRQSRGDPITVPRVVNLEYYDTEGGLSTDKQTSDRSMDSRSKAESTTQTSVIMRADDAARCVAIGHKVAIEEQRGDINFSLGDNFLYLTLADIITLNGQRMRITSCELDVGQQNYRARHDRASAYQSTIQGLPITVPEDAPGLVVSPTVMHIVDTHILSDGDDAIGFYVAISSNTRDWNGCVVEMSRDAGANWVESDTVDVNCIMGETVQPLPWHPYDYRDDINTLTVKLLRSDMELISATQTDMQNRMNMAIVDDEIINFSGVEQVDETTWKLTGLLRGRKGTHFMMPTAGHRIGVRFVMLDRRLLTWVDMERFDYAKYLTFRATSYGVAPVGVGQTNRFDCNAQIERAVDYLTAERQGNELRVTWKGNGKLGGGVNVGMGQYFTGYRVSLGTFEKVVMEQEIRIPYQTGVLNVWATNSVTGNGRKARIILS